MQMSHNDKKKGKKLLLPLCPDEAVKFFGSCLTQFEQSEVLRYKEVWYLGLRAKGKIEPSKDNIHNQGFDYQNSHYKVVIHDHIAYRYEVLDVIGCGRFGLILKCKDHKAGKCVAIKILRNHPGVLSTAKREVDILQCLQRWDRQNTHNVVHIGETFHFRKHYCVVLELLGENLKHVLLKKHGQGFGEADVQSIAKSLLKFLQFLQRLDITHGHLKTQNVLLSGREPGQIKVIDFSLSYHNHGEKNPFRPTLSYCPPELIMGHPCRKAVDMWSLGCTLFELLTGCSLFDGDNEQHHIDQIIEVMGKPPSDFLSKLSYYWQCYEPAPDPSWVCRCQPLSACLWNSSPECLDFIQRCLEWKPEKRMTTDEAMKHRWTHLQMRESTITQRPSMSLKEETPDAEAPLGMPHCGQKNGKMNLLQPLRTHLLPPKHCLSRIMQKQDAKDEKQMMTSLIHRPRWQ